MRTYYLFCIKDEIYDITKNSPKDLYCSFERIYKMNKNDINIGYNIYKRIANQINKPKINRLITSINENNINYTCFNYNHVINNFYNNENTKLTIYNSYIVIKTNASIPSFFKDFNTINNLFVIDFNNEDYFYLKKALVNV
ncbi:MAG: sporulation inhibitor of replication protein SirA [Bacilli bacterium]